MPGRRIRFKHPPTRLRPQIAGLGGDRQWKAIIEGARPGPNLYQLGMAGMENRRQLGGVVEDLVNQSTGGALASVQTQLGQVAFALKLSTAAAIGGALVTVVALILGSRRK
jgi:hypothetical protein